MSDGQEILALSLEVETDLVEHLLELALLSLGAPTTTELLAVLNVAKSQIGQLEQGVAAIIPGDVGVVAQGQAAGQGEDFIQASRQRDQIEFVLHEIGQLLDAFVQMADPPLTVLRRVVRLHLELAQSFEGHLCRLIGFLASDVAGLNEHTAPLTGGHCRFGTI